jgi:hypothetical protein
LARVGTRHRLGGATGSRHSPAIAHRISGQLKRKSGVVAFRTAGRARSALERVYESEKSLPLERQYQMRKRRALHLLGKERSFAVRLPVHYKGPARSKRKSGARPYVLQSFAGDDRDRREISVHHTTNISNRCREQDFVSESYQRLRQPFEQRRIGADENHFCH